MRLIPASLGLALVVVPAVADPLPSWNDTDAKEEIIGFVEEVTDPESEDFVPREDRIAVFDNDGTLWAEQPFYFQLIFAVDRFREFAEEDPAILTNDIRKAAAEGDFAAVLSAGIEEMYDIIALSHANITVEDFQEDVQEWFEEARHPTTGMQYNHMVYQPMLELLRYLRDEGFETWIVSGGGIHFIRSFADDAYRIPTDQVVGTRSPTAYEDGEIVKKAGIEFVDDKAGKPAGIDTQIGKRPIFAGGNSDGDFEMLEYVTDGDGPSFGLLIHHTDGEREFKYDREGHIGVLNKGLDEGPERGWLIVDMAEDWGRVWPQ